MSENLKKDIMEQKDFLRVCYNNEKEDGGLIVKDLVSEKREKEKRKKGKRGERKSAFFCVCPAPQCAPKTKTTKFIYKKFF